MKIGDLVWDECCNEPVVLLKKETNVRYIIFSPKDGVIEVNRKSLIPMTPADNKIKQYNKKKLFLRSLK